MKATTLIIYTAQGLFKDFLERHKEELVGRTGLCIYATERYSWESEGAVLGHFNFPNGTIDLPKLSEKMAFAASKVAELIKTQYLTTFPTQDYAANKFGGGIAALGAYVAVSGFPPKLDHQFLMEVLVQCTQTDNHMRKMIWEEYEIYKDKGVS